MYRSAALMLVLISACSGGPLGPLAGGRLSGTDVAAPVKDWDFARDHEHIEVEVRPDDPYSVKIHYYVVGKALYIEAAPNGFSRWRPLLQEDPRARVRFGDRVYAVTAVEVTDPVEISAVLPAFYEKDADEPSAECRVSWSADVCGFQGRFYRLESEPVSAPAPRRS